MDAVIELDVCPVCSSRYSAPRSPAFGHPFLNVEVDGFQIPMSAFVQYQECLECGTHYQNPRMGEETLNRWYESGTYRKWLNQPQSVLDKDEFSRSFGTVEWLEENYLPKGETIKVLDIGCSRGYLLDMLKHRNPEVIIQGVESNLNYVTEKDVPVVKDLSLLKGFTYDIITMIHVLEHVPYPVQFLREVRNLMNESSLMVIEVPSAVSKGGPYRLAHLTYLPPHALKTALDLAGLYPVDWVKGEHTRVVCRVKTW